MIWSKGKGEPEKLDLAIHEVGGVESDESPRELLPFDIARLVQDTDITLSMRLQHRSVPSAVERCDGNKSVMHLTCAP